MVKLTMEEKKTVYDFASPDYDSTTARRKELTALAIDPETKFMLKMLTKKLEQADEESWHYGIYQTLRVELERYRQSSDFMREYPSHNAERIRGCGQASA